MVENYKPLETSYKNEKVQNSPPGGIGRKSEGEGRTRATNFLSRIEAQGDAGGKSALLTDSWIRL